MAYRLVTGKLSDITSATNKFGGTAVLFRLEKGTFNNLELLPPQETKVVCDANGVFSANLWCNDGYIETRYSFHVTGEKFFFTLPPDVIPADISQLRLAELIRQGSDVSGNPDAISTETYRLLVTPTTGQTVFQLPEIPSKPQFSEVYVNGVKISYPKDYIIDGTRLIITLTEYTLETTDTVEIIFS